MARQIIARSKHYTNRDFINSRNGEALQTLESDTITVKAWAVITDEDEKGNTQEIGSLVTDDMCYTTISANIIDSIHDLIAIEEEENNDSGYQVRINKRKSKQGRDFLSLIIL